MWVTGTLVAEWPSAIDPAAIKTPDYVLIPDSRSAKILPHFTNYRVQWIEIQNGLDALQMAAGTDTSQRLVTRNARVVKITGLFLIERYVVGVECDTPWARAIVVNVKIPDQGLVAFLDRPETCCGL
jgi:hypothetical protein